MIKRVAIACGHFFPELGYLEAQLAHALMKLGYEVCVFSSDHVPAYAMNKVNPNREEADTCKVVRLPARKTRGQMVEVSAKALTGAINEFDPQVVFTIGVGKLFPKPIYVDWERNYKVVTFFGDNSDNFNLRGTKGGFTRFIKKIRWKLLRTWYKNPAYKLAVVGSDLLVGYTPETQGMLHLYLRSMRKEVDKKYMQISLGFDNEVFYFNGEWRKAVREQFGIKDGEKLFITATRMLPHKEIEAVLYALADQPKKEWKYMLCGIDDGDYSTWLKQKISDEGIADKVILQPFLSNEELAKMYSGADCGVWYHPTISVLPAMGTGLPVVMQYRPKIDHLTRERLVSVCDNNLKEVLELQMNRENPDAAQRMKDAEAIQEEYTYPGIVRSVLNKLNA